MVLLLLMTRSLVMLPGSIRALPGLRQFDDAPIRKSASETSKKMLPTALTLIRAVVVETSGRVTCSEPSFGVLAISVVGKVSPPSVESRMLTLAALTGAAVVDATFQVTVCRPLRFSPPLGAVRRNGPAAVVEVTWVVALPSRPPPARLSLTVTLKFMVRLLLGKVSPTLTAPAVGLGKLRVGLVLGGKVRNSGCTPSSIGTAPAPRAACVPRSNCSQT